MINSKTVSLKNFNYIYIIKELFPYLWIDDWKIKFRIIIAFLLMLFKTAVTFGSLFALKKIIDSISVSSQDFYLSWFFIYGFLWTSGYIFEQLRYFVMYRVLERGMNLLGQRIFNHLLLLPSQFHNDSQTGAINNAIHLAQEGYESIFWGILAYTLPSIIEVVSAFIMLWYLYGLFFSEVMLFIIVLYFIFTFLAIEWSISYRNLSIKKNIQVGARIVDSLLNLEIIKYFNNENYETAQFNKTLQEKENASTKKAEKEELVNIGQWCVLGIGLIIMTILSGKAVVNGKMSVGDFTLINGYIIQFASSSNDFGYILSQIRRGFADMQYIMNILNKKSEVSNNNIVNINNEAVSLSFENVIFGYDNKKIVLKNISFNIPAGRTIAIVGSTGVGKSTISKLIFRFYDVNYGKIKINGQDIREMDRESICKIVGIVPQDMMLFNNTLYYNIAYGNPDASKEQIENAISLAQLDSFIKTLPDGYNTIVGEQGLNLSGGEKQRIAIARVVLKNPKIYIFDEATSALDINTEKDIQRCLKQISLGSTTIIISHRLSTITHADEILVLDRDQIIERGTHLSLLNQNGFYSQLWQKQL